MNENERDEFFAVLRQMHHAYRKKMSVDNAEMWFQIFRRRFVPMAVFRKAIIMACERERALPVISTVLRYCDEARAVVERRSLPSGSPEAEAVNWCGVCQDTGWEPFWCVGRDHGIPVERLEHDNDHKYELKECGRDKQHPPHSWVRKCNCRATNPVYLREHPVKPKRFAEDELSEWKR